MKHYKSINKLYYDIVLKEEIDERPVFIMQYEDGYLIFRDRTEIYIKSGSIQSAEIYVRETFGNPQVIIIDFKKKIKEI